MPEQHKGKDHDPHPADQGLHFEQILGFWPSRRINEEAESVFAKNAGNSQQNARRERLFIRKSAFSAIFLLRIRCREVLSNVKEIDYETGLPR